MGTNEYTTYTRLAVIDNLIGIQDKVHVVHTKDPQDQTMGLYIVPVRGLASKALGTCVDIAHCTFPNNLGLDLSKLDLVTAKGCAPPTPTHPLRFVPRAVLCQFFSTRK